MTISAYSTLKALADWTRLRIMCLVHSFPGICVCQLIDALELTQTTVSKALGVLKTAGLVTDEREGQWVRYRPSKAASLKRTVDVIKWASQDPVMQKDRQCMTKLNKVPLDTICSNKPWRK